MNKINRDQAEVREKIIIEEVTKKEKQKRGNSIAVMKTMTSTASFGAKNDQSVEVIKIYQ